MKKIKFISALALTMVLASCENYDLPNPPGQTNPEPDGIFANSGLVIKTAENTELNLINASTQNVNVHVADITALENFPADYDLVINMEVAGDANFSKVAVANTTVVDNAIMVNPDILNNAIKEAITKEPGTRDVYARYVALAQRGNTTLRLGGLDAYFAADSKYSVTSLNPEKWMENTFFVVPCDAAGNADFAKAVKMDNTLGNVSVYDNPEFAVKIDVTDAGYAWKLAPVSVYESKDASKLLGCIPSLDSDLAGKLAVGSGAGQISLVGSVLVTVNVYDDSYTVNYAFECLYPFSGSVKAENVMKLYTSDYINYSGVTAINRKWTLAAQPDKNGPVVFKMVEGSEVIDENGLYESGMLTSGDGLNITAPVKGNTLYWTEVNLVQLKFSVKAMTSLSVIGAGNDWNLETATPLTPSKDLRTWTAENVEIGSEFKINANGAWDLDFGGKSAGDGVYTLDFKGSNMQCVEPGTYKVTIDFSKQPYTLTLEK